MSKNRFVMILPAPLGLILVLGTSTASKACAIKEDGTWMHCHTAQTMAAGIGCVICLLALCAVFLQTGRKNSASSGGSGAPRAAVIALYAACIAGAAAAFMIPGGIIPMCMMNTMRCHAVMKPFVRVMSALIIAACAAALGVSLHEGKKR